MIWVITAAIWLLGMFAIATWATLITDYRRSILWHMRYE